MVIVKDKETILEQIQHKHPLNLIDLQLKYRKYYGEDDDDDDIGDRNPSEYASLFRRPRPLTIRKIFPRRDELIRLQKFKCQCKRCGTYIDWYHRYYYRCSRSSCNYSLHKFCAELPVNLRYHSHPAHNLVLENNEGMICPSCSGYRYGLCYHCNECKYQICLPCATLVDQSTIHHPGHPHPLVSVRDNDILCRCFACLKKHQGVFFHCITCLKFSIHVDCVSLPIKLSPRDTRSIHRHLLTLSYSTLGIPIGRKCRCGIAFKKKCWIYTCVTCDIYFHLDCATSRREPFLSIVTGGLKDYDPRHIQFPLLDETYDIIRLMFKADASRYNKQTIDKSGYLIHFIHEHPLILIQDETNVDPTAPSSSRTQLIQLHSPMKRIRLLCNGCSRPITSFPYYKCSKEDECSEFVLHEWCTQLSTELKSYPDHSEHTLHLISNVPNNVCGVFECSLCKFLCNGFAYGCHECKYYIDINCAYMPEKIEHEAHPDHLLTREYVLSEHGFGRCGACLAFTRHNGFRYSCSDCDFKLHHQCALYLVKTIRHKYDKHSLRLTYSPIENHNSDYFCEICENEIYPYKWFYHCSECASSIHCYCAPLILNFEQDDEQDPDGMGVCRFINLKFGGVFETKYHRDHPLSLAIGTESLANCSKCMKPLIHTLIFKCLVCEFGHHYSCNYFTRSWYIKKREGERSNMINHYLSEINLQKDDYWRVVRPST